MAQKKTSNNYTYTCPLKLKEKFEREFIDIKKGESDVSINTSKILRITMEILLEKKNQLDFSEAYNDQTLKQALKSGLEKKTKS